MTNKELEIYTYVEAHAPQHLMVILRAITDGINNHNEDLRERKAAIEAGFVSTIIGMNKKDINKIKPRYKQTILDGLNKCTSIGVDDFIKLFDSGAANVGRLGEVDRSNAGKE